MQAAEVVRITSRMIVEQRRGRRASRRVFFLEHLDPEGLSTCVWEGPCYETAILSAAPWEARGCEVIDAVVPV